MADVTFGAPATDPLGIAVANFALIDAPRRSTLSSDTAKDGMGEYVPATDIAFGQKETINCSYEAQVNGAVGVLTATVGSQDAIAIDSISIQTTKGARATGSATGHQHIGGTGTAHNDSERTVTLLAFNGFGASTFGLTIGVPSTSLQSASYKVDVGHTDEEDAAGNWLCGASHGERHVVSFEAIDETAWSTPAGWIRIGDTPNPTGGAGKFVSTSASFFKTVAGPA